MYQQNAKRIQLQESYSDYGEYLDSLEMKAAIKPFEPLYIERIAQLTNKSNQFNLTTRRFTQAQIEAFAVDPGYITRYGKLADRFGDNGVVSVVIGRKGTAADVEIYRRGETPDTADGGGGLHLELWLMSWRVLKRDMELAMMDSVVEA